MLEVIVLKYFTKELVEEMQVYGFLVLPESEEEWEEMLRSYENDGMNYIDLIKEELEFRKKDLLKYLPESIHPYIHNKTLRTEYPSHELREIITNWCENHDEKFRRLCKEYYESYGKIKNELPEAVVQFHKRSLHDAKVISFEYIREKQECIMVLDHFDGEKKRVSLTFNGVVDVKIEENIEEAYWLYDEVYKDGDYFELKVLFSFPLTEISIKAKDLLIKREVAR